MATAFISHASQDREVAERICSFLEEREIRCWIAPRDVRPGRKYGEEIVDGIQRADAVVLVLSENANSSTFVEREIERAVSYGKPTLPVRVREVQPSRSLELFISSAHWIDAWKPPMEQYLDRLADSIRSLSPEGVGTPETKRRKMQIGWRAKRLAKRIAISSAVLFLLAVGATATWWLLGRQRSAQVVVPAPSATMTPKMEIAQQVVAQASVAPSAALTEPPEKTSPSPVSINTPTAATAENTRTSEPAPSRPEENAAVVASFLTSLGNTTSRARDQAIEQHAQNLPEQISVSNLLSIIEGTYARNEMIKLLVPKLPNPIPVPDTLRILRERRSRERSELIAILISHLPQALSSRELLALIEGAYARNDMIKSLVNRLPVSHSIEETLQILDHTNSRERSELIRILLSRIPAKLSVKDLLAVIENGYARNDLIKSLVTRLPVTLSADECLEILGDTSSRERSELIAILSAKVPPKLAVDDLLRIIGGGYDRNDLIKLLVNRLPNPLTVDDLLRILASTASRERDALIQIIAPRAPAHLSPEQLAALVRGGYATADDEKLLKH